MLMKVKMLECADLLKPVCGLNNFALLRVMFNITDFELINQVKPNKRNKLNYGVKIIA